MFFYDFAQVKIPAPLSEVRGFVLDYDCDLYIFPLTWLEMMHIGESVHELVCIFLVDRQLCDFQRSGIISPAP